MNLFTVRILEWNASTFSHFEANSDIPSLKLSLTVDGGGGGREGHKKTEKS